MADSNINRKRSGDNNDDPAGNNREAGEPPFAPTGMKPKSLSSLLAGYKSTVTNKINKSDVGKIKIAVWQRNYHEHIIRDEKSYHRITEYIQNNPQKWKDDKFFRE